MEEFTYIAIIGTAVISMLIILSFMFNNKTSSKKPSGTSKP